MKITIHYNGRMISMNDYKNTSWSKLRKKIISVKWEFISLILNKKMPELKSIKLVVLDNTKLDVDNVAATVKIFVDALRHCNIIKEDDKKYFPSMLIKYAPEIPKGYLYFEITAT